MRHMTLRKEFGDEARLIYWDESSIEVMQRDDEHSFGKHREAHSQSGDEHNTGKEN